MSFTLSTLRTRIRNNWPSGFFTTNLTNTQLDTWINDTQRWVCQGVIYVPDEIGRQKRVCHNFTWQKEESQASTVNRQRRYSLPDGSGTVWKFKTEISLEIVKYDRYRQPLTKRLKNDIENDSRFADTTGYGIPECYCLDDGDIWLFKLPDHSYNNNEAFTLNLEYYGYLPDLSGDDDHNVISDECPEVLEYGCTEAGFRFARNFEEAEYWAAKKQQKFIEMLTVDQHEEFATLEEGMRPAAGQGLGEGSSTYLIPQVEKGY